MRLDRWLTLKAVAPLQRAFPKGIQPGIPILMYHSISEDHEPGVGPYYRLATPPGLFRDQMHAIRDSGFQVVSLATAADALARGLPHDTRMVAITFDDGFRDFLVCAWPVLEAMAFNATVFLPVAYIGSQRRTFKNRECLTWDEIRALSRKGISFGSHTVTHPRLSTLPEAALLSELSDSRAALEQQLGESIDQFAHPYSFPMADRNYLERYRRCMLRAGYRVGVTTTVGRACNGSDPLLLLRLPVNGADDVPFFLAKLHGAYDWVRMPQAIVKHARAAIAGRRAEVGRET